MLGRRGHDTGQQKCNLKFEACFNSLEFLKVILNDGHKR